MIPEENRKVSVLVSPLEQNSTGILISRLSLFSEGRDSCAVKWDMPITLISNVFVLNKMSNSTTR
jgi:hypothetical protein